MIGGVCVASSVDDRLAAVDSDDVDVDGRRLCVPEWLSCPDAIHERSDESVLGPPEYAKLVGGCAG